MPTPPQFWLNLPNTKAESENERIIERCIRELPTGTTRIERQDILSATASVTFNNIPQIYNYLRFVCVCRSDNAAADVNIFFRPQNDSGANYLVEQLVAVNVTPSAANNQVGTDATGNIPANTADAHLFGWVTAEFYNYSDTFMWKPILVMSGESSGVAASDILIIRHNTWKNSAAINSVTILPSAGNFMAHSTFSLYGVF